MNAADQSRLREVSALLGREICRPIASLRANLVQLLEDAAHPPSPAERAHAATMLTLCDELEQLTHDHLGTGTGDGQVGPDVPGGQNRPRATG